MNILWHKVGADLWEHRARTFLAILSIGSGLFIVGTLFGMVDLQLSILDRAHRESVASHIRLFVNPPVERPMLSVLATMPEVEAVDPMNESTVRYRKPGEAAWSLGTLVSRPNWVAQRYDRMALVAGAWPSDTGLGIERLTSVVTGLSPGSTVLLETADGERELTIQGLVRHPFVKPPAFGGQAHFFVNTVGFERFSKQPGNFRQLLVRTRSPYDAEKARRVAGVIRRELGSRGVGVQAALLQDPDRHWGRSFVEGIDRVLQIMGVGSLAISALLIFNTFAALVGQQADQIGILKSLGGGRNTLIRIYLLEALCLGLIAVLLALPLSLAGSWLSTRWSLDLFNIGLERYECSWRAVWLVLGGGLLVPPLASLGPVLRGASMTVREAFARYGLGSDFGRGRFDRWVGKAAGQVLPVLYASAFTNLLRRKIRLLLTGCALLMGGVGFLVSMSLLASVNLTLDNETARVGYDVRLGLKEAAPVAKLATTLKDVGGVQQSETWFRSPISLTRNGSELRFQGSFGAQAVGLPAGSRMYRPLLVAGRWIEPGDADRRVLVLNAETAEASGLHVGDELTLTAPGRPSEAWSVLGLYRWVTESGYLVEPVYAPLPALWAASGRWRMATQLLVKADVASLDSEAALADTLKAKAESAGLELDYYTTSARRLQRIHAGKQFRSVVFTLLGLAAMLGTVGAIALSGALSMSVMQRRREIGVLRALGAPSVAVFQWFFLEGLFQALLAWALAIPVARVLSEVMSSQLGQTMLNLDLDYAFHWPAIWIWLGATLAIALVASTGPALGATRVTVRESLAYQ